MTSKLAAKIIVRGIFLCGNALLSTLCCFAQDEPPPYMPNEVLVGIKPGQERRAEQIFAELRLNRIESVDNLRLYRMRLPEGRTVEETIQVLRRTPNVFQSPEPNFTAKAINDPMFVGLQQWGPGTIGAKHAWTLSVGNPNLKIAILDTGFARFGTHGDLNPAREIAPYDAVNTDVDQVEVRLREQ
jgi:cell division protein YceG involved in septum cleavage